ncbi:MAG: DUF3817 domain-containing protein [Bacteroidota bacterium]
MQKNLLLAFKRIAFAEGCSYLLFGITMPLKYAYGIMEPNYYIGMTHGVLFMLYVLFLVLVAIQYKWSLGKTFLFFLASFIPFGTFYSNTKL